MTATFTLAGRVLDKSKHPLKREKLILSANDAVTADPATGEVYTVTPDVMTDDAGNLCRVVNGQPDEETGVELIVGPQYTLRSAVSSRFEPLTFNSPSAGTTLQIATIVSDPVDLPPTWSETTGALAANITEGDAETLAAAQAYTDSHSSSVADASTTVKGIVELATNTETTTGTDTVRAVTPAGVKAVADALATTSATDATTKANAAQAAAATDATNKVATETARAVAAEATKVNSSTYTAGLTAADDTALTYSLVFGG